MIIDDLLLFGYNQYEIIETPYMPKDRIVVDSANKTIMVRSMYHFFVTMKMSNDDFCTYDFFAGIGKCKRDQDLFPIFAKHEVELLRFLNRFK